MRILERLAALDDAVLPRSSRWRERYDRRVPLWFAFGSPVGTVLGITIAQVAFHTSGAARVVLLALAVGLLVTYSVAAHRWQRDHRRQPTAPAADSELDPVGLRGDM